MDKCEHKRIISKNCVLFCLACGQQLPADFLAPRTEPEKQPAPEQPAPERKKRGKAK